MTGVLGVPTIQYLPYAFFNILNPLIALMFAFVGYRVEHLPPAATRQPGSEDRRVIDHDGLMPQDQPAGGQHVQ
jgi:hypothetical protein